MQPRRQQVPERAALGQRLGHPGTMGKVQFFGLVIARTGHLVGGKSLREGLAEVEQFAVRVKTDNVGRARSQSARAGRCGRPDEQAAAREFVSHDHITSNVIYPHNEVKQNLRLTAKTAGYVRSNLAACHGSEIQSGVALISSEHGESSAGSPKSNWPITCIPPTRTSRG